MWKYFDFFFEFSFIFFLVILFIFFFFFNLGGLYILNGRFFKVVSFLVFWWLFGFLVFSFDLNYCGFSFFFEIKSLIFRKFILCFGLDGLSLFMIFLSLLVITCCILYSWGDYNFSQYFLLYFWLFLLLVLSFVVLDLFLFYILFEIFLIPLYLFIGFGSYRKNRILAAYLFFLFTVGGSLILFLLILYFSFLVGTDIYNLWFFLKFYETTDSFLLDFIFFSFLLSFAVKVPIIPLHIWLPEAHGEAPTAGSVILSGLILKLGIYGIVRFVLPGFSEISAKYSTVLFLFFIFGLFFSLLAMLRQSDVKRIIAYSSVSHMHMCMLGLFSETYEGIMGALYLMICHGLTSSGLFFSLAMLTDRQGVRLFSYFGGQARLEPKILVCFFFFCLSNAAFPLTGSFIAEIFIIYGVFLKNVVIGLFIGLSMILNMGIWVWVFSRIFLGRWGYFLEFAGDFSYKMKALRFGDLNDREVFFLFVLIFFIFLMGIFPTYFMSFLEHIIFFILLKEI